MQALRKGNLGIFGGILVLIIFIYDFSFKPKVVI